MPEKVETVSLTCPHCGAPGQVARTLVGSGTEVKHSPNAGGCGLKFRA